MIHYSCDRCKREIDCLHESRYVLRLEVELATDRCEEELVDHVDHLMEIEEELDCECDFELSSAGISNCARRTYDLCSECYRQFIKNPLRNETPLVVGFSKN